MNSDHYRPPADAKFKQVGVGMAITRVCALCSKHRQTLGSKLVGPFRLFCCAQCLAERKKAKEAA